MNDFLLLLRVIAAIGLIILLPGYVVSYLLFPKYSLFDFTQRLALSGILGIFLTVIIGTLLVGTVGFFLRIYLPIMLFITLIGFIQNFTIIREDVRNFINNAKKLAFLVPILQCMLLLTVVLLIMPRQIQPAEKYTEFYVLDASGIIPYNLSTTLPNEIINLTVGIISHEYSLTTYKVMISVQGRVITTCNSIILPHNEKWEGNFTIPKASLLNISKQIIQIALFKDDSNRLYRNLQLSIITDAVTKTLTPENTPLPVVMELSPIPSATHTPTIISPPENTPTFIVMKLSPTPTHTPTPTATKTPTPENTSTPVLIKISPTLMASATPIHGLFLASQGITVSQEGRVIYSPYVIPSNTELAFSFRLIGLGVEPKLVGIGVSGGLFRSELGPYQINRDGKSFENLRLFFPQAGTFTLFVQIQAQSGEWRILEGESGEPQEGISIVVE